MSPHGFTYGLRTANSADANCVDTCRSTIVMATILYARVSTADQTLEHQRTHAEAAGFKFDQVLADHGVSGVSTKLADRQQGRPCSTCFARATRWWSVGLTALVVTTRTSAKASASSCGAASSSA